MDRELTPDEITELLPAYALDAVDDDERAAIDAYLDAHPEERAAVNDLQVTASMLAHTGGPPPEGVWERLESIIATTPPPMRIVPPTVLTPRSTPAPDPAPRPAVAVAGCGRRDRRPGLRRAVARRTGRRRRRRGHRTAALAATAATEPGTRHVTLTDEGGNSLATAVVTTDGAGYLTSELPPAPAGHTYQLWGITRTGTISLGVLGRDPGTVAFQAAGPTTSLAITTEVAGGVPVSRNTPDAVGDIA